MHSLIIFEGVRNIYNAGTKQEIRQERSVVLEHAHRRKFYPAHTLLSAKQAQGADWWHDGLEANAMVALAARLIRFADALGLPSIDLPKSRSGCHKHFPAGYGLPYYQFGHTKKDAVIFDNPTEMRPVPSDEWHSVWLPTLSDPLTPGLAHPRLSTRRNSCLDLVRLSERVSNLNFDPVVVDLTRYVIPMIPE
jgi:hypothetical protein